MERLILSGLITPGNIHSQLLPVVICLLQTRRRLAGPARGKTVIIQSVSALPLPPTSNLYDVCAEFDVFDIYLM